MSEQLLKPSNRAFYPALNGLLAFAILLVFCEHYLSASTPSYLEWGWAGVDIFFVLSGFLITGILIDTIDAPHRFRNFYIRRTLRIFPLYYTVLLVIVLLTPVFHWKWSAFWLLWPTYLGNYGACLAGYLQADNYDVINYLVSQTRGFSLHVIHFWSLCVEEQFYFIWPFVIYKVRKIGVIRNICIVVIVALPIIRIAARLYLPRVLIDLGILSSATFFRFDSFLVGGLLVILLRGEHAQRIRHLSSTICAGSILMLLAGWAFAVFVLHQGVSVGSNTPWMSTVGHTLVDFVSAALLLLALKPGSLVYRLFTLKPLDRLGMVSYGFYVYHDIPSEFYRYLARHALGPHFTHIGVLVSPIAFACTTALAFLSYRYLERPFLLMKKRYTR